MPRLVALGVPVVPLGVLLVALLSPIAVLAAANPASPPQPGILPPTAPIGDFNEPAQSSWAIVRAMHIRGPEKILGVVVVLLLMIALVMFAGMLRQVYGGPRTRRP